MFLEIFVYFQTIHVDPAHYCSSSKSPYVSPAFQWSMAYGTGIGGKTLKSIDSFLCDRQQRDCERS